MWTPFTNVRSKQARVRLKRQRLYLTAIAAQWSKMLGATRGKSPRIKVRVPNYSFKRTTASSLTRKKG